MQPFLHPLMYSVLLAFLAASLSAAQTVTVPANDARVAYTGQSWKNVTNICHYSDDGLFLPGQDGCFNLGTTPCTESYMLATQPGATASFTFTGTSIAVHTMTQTLNTVESLITITLDSDDKTIQSAGISGAITCLPPVFELHDLAADKEHTLNIVLRQPPATNIPTDQTLYLALRQFVITGGDIQSGSDTNTATTSSTGTVSESSSPSSFSSSSTTASGPAPSSTVPSGSRRQVSIASFATSFIALALLLFSLL